MDARRRPGTKFVADCADGAMLMPLTLADGEEVILECSPTTAPRIFYRDGRIEPLVLDVPDIFGDTNLPGRGEIVAPGASGEGGSE